MKVLRFTLSGKTGFFKKPEVNSYYYFTYGNIHKVALLGLFGALLGLEGHNQLKRKNDADKIKKLTEGYPEFYERLRDLQVSIEPNASKGFIAKKVQVYNNSVGYASKEQGGNLIIKEQWLENPSWTISVLIDSEEAEMVCEYVTSNKCVYYPYLGKNDHGADLSKIEVLEALEIPEGKGRLSSLFPKEAARIIEPEDEDEMGFSFKYQEKLPYKLNEITNNYGLKDFIYTDAEVVWEMQKVYQIDKHYMVFY